MPPPNRNQSSSPAQSGGNPKLAFTKSQDLRENRKHNFKTSDGSSMETLIITVPAPPKLVEIIKEHFNIVS